MNTERDTEILLELDHRQMVRVRLGSEISAAGSHGLVRAIADSDFSDLVVKISHDSPSSGLEARISAFLRDQRDWGVPGYFRAAWPVARAYDGDTLSLIGFAMPRLAQPNYFPLQIMYDPAVHKRTFPECSWTRYVMVAADVARAVNLANERDYVIGDLCSDNIFVTRAASVALADVDDWQIGAEGKHGALPCRGSRADYTPPEYLDKAGDEGFRTKYGDRWALAVLIGELLFTGTKPFAGFAVDSHESWEDRDNVEARQCWLLGADLEVTAPTPSPQILTTSLRALFERCFVAGYDRPSRRPHPSDWIGALEALSGELRNCGRSALHVFPRTCTKCPWCEVVEKGCSDKFTFLPVNAPRATRIAADPPKDRVIEPTAVIPPKARTSAPQVQVPSALLDPFQANSGVVLAVIAGSAIVLVVLIVLVIVYVV